MGLKQFEPGKRPGPAQNMLYLSVAAAYALGKEF